MKELLPKTTEKQRCMFFNIFLVEHISFLNLSFFTLQEITRNILPYLPSFYHLVLKKTHGTLVNSYVYLLYVHAAFLMTGLYLSSCHGRVVAIAEIA